MKSRLRLLCWSLVLAVLLSQSAKAANALVLISNADSAVSSLTSLEIRKLYLGFVVFDNHGNQIRAIINDTEPRLMDVFLQNVMAMSRTAYNHRLLTLTVQTGRPRPPLISNRQALRSALQNDLFVVTCMWQRDILHDSNIKIIKVLWTE